MTNNQFKQLSQSMKEHDIDVCKLTEMVNMWQDEFHVCEQEMMNYLLKNEPMPEELETVLVDMFNIEEEQGEAIAPGQISMDDIMEEGYEI